VFSRFVEFLICEDLLILVQELFIHHSPWS